MNIPRSDESNWRVKVLGYESILKVFLLAVKFHEELHGKNCPSNFLCYTVLCDQTWRCDD
jgi:hypothetical protein